MKKLLLVENSSFFAKALSKSFAGNNYFEIHYAASFTEVKELLAEHDYYLAISNLVLPDAGEGEVIYKLIACDIPVICLTGSFNMQLKISSLPIVDYVVKEGKSSLRYVVRLAELLLETLGMKVLVVADDTSAAAGTLACLQPFRFQLHHCKTSEAALGYLKEHPDVAMIVCDDQLSDTQGLNFVRDLRKSHDQLAQPVLYTLAQHNPEFSAKLLKTGVNDFLVRPYAREEMISRVFNIINTRVRYTQVQRYASTLDRYIITSSTDEAGIIREVSQAFCDISGYRREELIGRSHNIVRHPEMKNHVYKTMWQTISAGKSWQGELKNRKKDGGYYWVNVHIDPVFDARGEIAGYTAIRQDITDKKYIEELSVTDPMTGLYNRRHFSQHFDRLAEQAQQKQQSLAFLIFDVDHFKGYNDHYGHQAGDEVLIALGETVKRLSQSLNGYAYRLGGEEFALLYLCDSLESGEHLAEQTRAAIEGLGVRHEHNSAADVVTASFGLWVQQKTADIEQTYKTGDDLLYQAKSSGRNRVLSASDTGSLI